MAFKKRGAGRVGGGCSLPHLQTKSAAEPPLVQTQPSLAAIMVTTGYLSFLAILHGLKKAAGVVPVSTIAMVFD